MGAFRLNTVGDQFLLGNWSAERTGASTSHLPDSLTSPEGCSCWPASSSFSCSVGQRRGGQPGPGSSRRRSVRRKTLSCLSSLASAWAEPEGIRTGRSGVWTWILRSLFSKCFLVKSQNHRHWTFSNHA
uniref:Uncharacterized protein n=1 Tax=Pipistrellus kuhlii TaxID=59472 RepID=A0A7J7RMN6_PIPKU|nr:hypothetical protein mPipKuh1_010409 [Pipistrellus kuhlii]